MVSTEKLTITSDAPGKKLFMLGNEAIARGALEAGVQVVAAYPGTPSTEVAETLLSIAQQMGFYGEWSVNEKVALGVAMGASMSGVRSMAIMKHVGVNVALDLLMTATYLGAKGGLVLVEAEDPGQWSSSDEQDNRFLAEEAYLPILEPSSPQEAKEMTRLAFELSEEFGQPFMIRSVTRIGHARGDVTLGQILPAKRLPVFEKDPGKWVMLPAVARKHRRLMIARLQKIRTAVDSLEYNQLQLVTGAKFGLIASGISYGYAMEAINMLGLQGKVSILKIGTPYPLPEKQVKNLLSSVPDVLVIEELEPYLENHVKVVAQEAEIKVRIHGKALLPEAGELSTRKVVEAISQLTGTQLPQDFPGIDQLVQETEPLLPSRPPNLCAGCPHRASHYVMNLAVERVREKTGLDTIRPGDIGCYCLGANPPLSAVDTSTCMGSGFDLANGLARVLKEPVVGHMGDSTFFHSGIPPMINAVYNNTRLTMVVLDNLTTAMTGSQPNPASGSNARDSIAPRILPEEIAKASGVKFVEVLDPYDLNHAVEVMEKAILFDGPSFIVFRSPCSILDQRNKRAKGEKITPFTVDQSKCLAQSPPACTAACPLHIDVRGYVNLAKEGRFSESLKLIKEKLPFPAILGRICTHPCETDCQRRKVEDPIAIMALKRAAADYGFYQEDLSISLERKEKVAIIGAGPAGLLAAYDLRKLGYQVTIFEAASRPGGMLLQAIPRYRLPEEVISKELEIIPRMGITLKTNTRIGSDLPFLSLQKEFQAIFIATGAPLPRKPSIPGCDTEGVISGIELLRKINAGQPVEVRGKVKIIGGGNVAIDCARSCLRLGASDVEIIYRRSQEEMPALPEEVREAINEGVRIRFLTSPTRIISDGGRIRAVECIKMSLGQPDSGGRRQPIPIPDSEFALDTDMLVFATGEQPDLTPFIQNGINLPVKDGLIQVDPLTMETGLQGVFAGGDVVTGPSSVIEALAAGRKAAISIHRYLQGESLQSGRESEGKWESRLVINTTGVQPQSRLTISTLPVAERRYNQIEVDRGYTQEEAKNEAARCLNCGCQVCVKKLGCPALVVEGETVTIDRSQCPGCGLCASICPAEAIVKESD